MEKFNRYLEKEKYSTRTRIQVICTIKKYKKWLQGKKVAIEEIKYRDIVNYIEYLRSKVSVAYINNELIRIGHYYKYLKIDNPAYRVKLIGEKKRKIRLLENTELESIYDNYKYETLEEEIIIGLSIYQGIRRPELLRIETKDIDIKKGIIRIPSTYNANERKLKLEPIQIIPLTEQISSQKREHQQKLLKSALTVDILYKKLKKWIKKVQDTEPKVKNFNHICRSRYGIWIRENGPRIGQYKSGFKTIKGAENYKKEDITELKESIKRYHPLNKVE